MSPEKLVAKGRVKTERNQPETGDNGNVDCMKLYENVFTELIEI